jgi:UrcA family protein
MTRKLFAVVSACAFLGAALAATPALAADEIATMRVSTGDLNLQSNSGAQDVLRRIENASSAFCGIEDGNRDLGRQLESLKCRNKMTYLAVSKLDAPLVTAMYRSSGAGPPVLLAHR